MTLYSSQDRSDDAILALLAQGFPPDEVAMHFCDQDVSAGEYEGCSFELDLAASEYTTRAQRILDEVGGF